MIARLLAFAFVIGVSGCVTGSHNGRIVEPLPEFHRCELSGAARDGTYTITKTMTLDGKPYKPYNVGLPEQYFKAEWIQKVGNPGSYGLGQSGYSLGIHWSGDQTSLLSRDTAASILVNFANPIPERYKVVIERPSSTTPPGWINLEMQTFFQNSTRADDKIIIARMRLSDLLAISNGEDVVLVKVIDEDETAPGVAQQSMLVRVADAEPALLGLREAMNDFAMIVDNYKDKCPKFQDEEISIIVGG